MYRYKDEMIYRQAWQTIKQLKRGFKDVPKVVGFDTEFYPKTGEPIYITLSDDVDRIWAVGGSDYFSVFMNAISEYPHNTIIWAHNLEVDLISLLAAEPEAYRKYWYKGHTVNLCFPEWKVDVKMSFRTPCFCVLRWYKGVKRLKIKKEILIYDTFAYFKTSLDQVSQAIFGKGKLPIPKSYYDIDWREVDPEDERRKYYEEYAKEDTRLVRNIGAYIIEMHKNYNVSCAVSLPSFSAKVFRKSIRADFPILSQEMFRQSLRCYYGGRVQTFYRGMVRGKIKKYDLNSAYAKALSDMPLVEEFETTKQIEPYGVYHAKMRVAVPSLPSTYKGRIIYPIGDIRGHWTGLELLSAMQAGFAECLWCWGYKPKSIEGFPFKEFVEDRFAEKRAAIKGTLEYEIPKLMVNALYGKTFNRIPSGKVARNGLSIKYPGSMFHPYYACHITAFCRSRIMEAQSLLGTELISFQTDGIWTTGNLPTSKAMGDFDLEVEADSLLSIRGNAYMPFIGGVPILENSKVHGFQGKKKHFIEALENGGRYEIEKWCKRHQASQRGILANTVLKRYKMKYNYNAFDYKVKFPHIPTAEILLSEAISGHSLTLEEIYNHKKTRLNEDSFLRLEDLER